MGLGESRLLQGRPPSPEKSSLEMSPGRGSPRGRRVRHRPNPTPADRPSIVITRHRVLGIATPSSAPAPTPIAVNAAAARTFEPAGASVPDADVAVASAAAASPTPPPMTAPTAAELAVPVLTSQRRTKSRLMVTVPLSEVRSTTTSGPSASSLPGTAWRSSSVIRTHSPSNRDACAVNSSLARHATSDDPISNRIPDKARRSFGASTPALSFGATSYPQNVRSPPTGSDPRLPCYQQVA